MTSRPALATAALFAAGSLALAAATPAQAATAPPTREVGDGIEDVSGTDDGSEYEERVNRARTDIDLLGYTVTASGESQFYLNLRTDVYDEVAGTSYTRSVTAKALDYKYKKIKGKKKKVVSKTAYTTRFTSVSTADSGAVAERLVDGEWEVLEDCFVEAIPEDSGSARLFYFNFDPSCFGPSIDYMTSEFRTETVDAAGQVWTDFAALGPVNP